LIEVDTHVHTVLSGHAFSTLHENIQYAKKKGLKGFCSTDHGPDLYGGAPDFIPYTMRTWPEYMDGIRVYRSCEANIIGINGELDYRPVYLDMLEFVSAGVHTMDKKYFNRENATKAYISAYERDLFDVATHIDHDRYDCDLEAVINAAHVNGKLIEVNNASYLLRPGSKERIHRIIDICKQTKSQVIVSSDSHICYNIGNISDVEKYLEKVKFPKEQIVNATFKQFDAYIKKRKERLEKD
jgi:putative hydrolase